MKKFVQISNVDQAIRVAPDLTYVDATNPMSTAGNRLNVMSMWQDFAIIIKKGVHYYPAEIKSWPSVQGHVKANRFVVGGEVEECNEPEAEELRQKLIQANKRFETMRARNEANLNRDKEMLKGVTNMQ